MKDLYLIRHGQSIGNVDNKHYSTTPDWKIPLTGMGELQAAAAGDELKRQLRQAQVAVYYSPMVRAADTYKSGVRSQILSNVIFEKEEPLVSEQSFGMINSYTHGFTNSIMMKTRAEYGSFYYTPPDGESGLDVLMRVKRLFDDIEKRGHDSVVIVSHGSFIKVLMMELLGWTVEQYDTYRRPGNGMVIHLQDVGDGDWVSDVNLTNRKPTDYA